MDTETIEDAPRHGCMSCKASQPYTVKQWPDGNTTWHCTVCGAMSRLILGKYTAREDPGPLGSR